MRKFFSHSRCRSDPDGRLSRRRRKDYVARSGMMASAAQHTGVKALASRSRPMCTDRAILYAVAIFRTVVTITSSRNPVRHSDATST